MDSMTDAQRAERLFLALHEESQLNGRYRRLMHDALHDLRTARAANAKGRTVVVAERLERWIEEFERVVVSSTNS